MNATSSERLPMADVEENERIQVVTRDLSNSSERSTTRSSTMKTQNFQKLVEQHKSTSFIVDRTKNESGKQDVGCDRDSSTTDMEDSTIFVQADHEISHDFDHDHNTIRLSSLSKGDTRRSFETSGTTMMDDSETEECSASQEEQICNTTIGSNVEDESSEVLQPHSDDDSIKSVESNPLRESTPSKAILGDDDNIPKSNHAKRIHNMTFFDDDDDDTEKSHRQLQNEKRKERVKTGQTLRSFLPGRKARIENERIQDETEIHDETESDSEESVSFRYRKRGDVKFQSALDLVYGHDEGYSSDGRNSYTSDRRRTFASPRDSQQNQSMRIRKKTFQMKADRIEAFCYNHGMEIAIGVLYFALNYLVAAHGAYQFTEAGGWTTDDDILRITLPIARAGGRLVTLNCALLLLTACKYLWTLIRTHVAPVIPIGFPIDDVMPKYHRYVALTVIISGCIIHSLPQIVNYATKSVSIDHEDMELWTFWDAELATKQLLISGTLLAVIFSTFYLTTLEAFRKTAAGFRWFWFFHVGGIATAYPLLLIHGTCRGRPVFLYAASLPLLLYLFDVCMRRSNISTAKIIRWETHEDEGQEITELVVECPANFDYTPGQYVDIKFPPISSREWHPFTIASAPNENTNSENGKKQIVFYIKNLGRWTGALFEYASAFDLSKARKAQKIYIQGPHGAPAMNYFAYKHILVIGSGVGVAPLLSIWKYLVAKGKSMTKDQGRKSESTVDTMIHKNIIDASENLSLSDYTLDVESHDDDISFGETLEISSAKSQSTLRADFILVQTILESMTVSLGLFVVFVLGETLTIVLQLFGSISLATTIGYSLSVFALIVHGTTIISSTIAMGWHVYCRNFRCWLEFSIVFMDSIAVWFSVRCSLKDANQEQSREDIIIYFTIFTYVVILHAIRIFHMFYVALKPATSPAIKTKKKPGSLLSLNNKAGEGAELCSVEGILINRKYSSMRFAAKDLLPPIMENGLSNLYSMRFYGTREIEMEKDEEVLINDMMGTSTKNTEESDIRTSLLYGNQNNFFCAGRPDWNRIFLKAIARAHCTGKEGESVGVFFCGSPAIAKDLQAEAKRVTAQHQFAMKQLDARPCKCKLIVHTERF